MKPSYDIVLVKVANDEEVDQTTVASVETRLLQSLSEVVTGKLVMLLKGLKQLLDDDSVQCTEVFICSECLLRNICEKDKPLTYLQAKDGGENNVTP